MSTEEPRIPADQNDAPGSGRTLWLDPGFGASGDMILGTLLGLGAPIEAIRSGLQRLAIDGWTLGHETTMRCSLSADRAVVEHREGHHHRTWTSIDALLAGSDLPERVKVGGRATFRRLGEVEAGIHNVDIDDVHFHEVGAVDAIVDIIGSWLALDALDVDGVVCGPVGLGHGSITAAHGRLPVPAPATAELLVGATIRPLDVSAETVTPTGAALLASMADRWGTIPAGRLLASARGAGRRDPDHYPNVITGYLVGTESTESTESTGSTGSVPGERHHAVILTTNLDDVTGEVIAHTIARCLAAGADDAWATPIIMKKGRPAVALHVLSAPERLDRLQRLVFSETATLGMRIQPVTKHVLPRHFESVTVRGRSIGIKIGPFGVKPEYDDLAEAAEQLEIPVVQLATEALSAFLAGDGADTFDGSFTTGIS